MEALDIENNSFLDYNTNSNLQNPEAHRPDYQRLTETNSQGETLLSFTVKIHSNHPLIAKRKIERELTNQFKCNVDLNSVKIFLLIFLEFAHNKRLNKRSSEVLKRTN